MSKGNGTRFIDRLIAASPTARRKVMILGQDVYFRPLTRQLLHDALPKDEVDRPPDYVGLFMLVECAEAEDGSKLFKRTDIEALRTKVSLALLTEIEQAMQGVLAPSEKEVAQEAKADPPSASG